jgi:hypothetical protein
LYQVAQMLHSNTRSRAGKNLHTHRNMNWWMLGEGSGYSGNDLEIRRITCPFCLEAGNFGVEHHATKRKANSNKILNFDTLRCGNCAGYVLVLWSTSEFGFSHALYEFRVLPWPQRVEKYPEEWPEAVGRFWIQAQRCLKDENWDAAAVMARSAMQVALRDQGANGANLKQEIDALASRGALPSLMKEWSHELRELGNESAHPDPSQAPTTHEDAKDIVRYLDFMLTYLYNLPREIEQYRKRRANK